MAEKTYINGLFIKKKRFENGGNVINISINSTTFIEELLRHKNEKGYVNITLKDMRETDKNGNNMYAILDTYKPKENNGINNNDISTDLPF